MKKLIFVFVALFVLVLISGCNSRNENTVRFDENGNEIASEENGEKMEENGEKEFVKKKPSGKLEVLSFDGAFLKTNVSHTVVEGSASSDTHTIKINDYKLQKYYPGAETWSYIASSKYGTLEGGWNNYVVKTFDKDGKQIDSLIFSIDYEAPVIPDALPGVGASHVMLLIFSMMMSGSYLVFRRYRWL